MPLEGQGLDLSYRLRSHGGSLITIGQENHFTSEPNANVKGKHWHDKQQSLLTLLMMRRLYGGIILKTLSPLIYSVAIMRSNSSLEPQACRLKSGQAIYLTEIEVNLATTHLIAAQGHLAYCVENTR